MLTLRFEFDPQKAADNLTKHRVSFQEAMTVFGDPSAQTFPDELHSDDEQRWITIGVSSSQRCLFLSHLESGNNIRLIGARLAEPAERHDYEQHKPSF